MKTITVIKSTGNPQGDRVLAGIYGNMEPPATGQRVGRMRVASDFGSVSHLFAYLEHGMAPITEGSTLDLVVEDNMEVPVKAQLMHAMGVRWSNMYRGALQNAQTPSIMQSMLKGEAAQVARGVHTHLEEMRMHAWLVPFTAEITTYVDLSGQEMGGDGQYAAPTERDLIKALRRQMPGQITLDTQNQPVDCGVEMLGHGFEVAASDAQPEPNGGPATPVPEWARWERLAANIQGSFVVVASDAEQAMQVARWTAEQHNRADSAIRLGEYTIEAITSMREAPFTQTDDDADTNGERSDRDRG